MGAVAYDAPAPSRRERNAAIVLVGGALPVVLALGWAVDWRVGHPHLVVFLAVAAVFAAVQGIEAIMGGNIGVRSLQSWAAASQHQRLGPAASLP